MAITYNITNDFAAKDALPLGDSGKIIRGSEFTTEFSAIRSALLTAATDASVALKANIATPTFTGTATFQTIALSGTVDGRDVAADGTKLDTVETNADVTDTANVTAAGALMDSELTSIAAVKALNQGVATTDSPTFATVTNSSLVNNGGINEQQYSLTGTVISPANGTIQYKTLAANTTFTESLSDGDYVTLMIDDGSARTITWPTISWVGGSAPTLETSGFNVIELWQVNGTVYGAFVGAA